MTLKMGERAAIRRIAGQAAVPPSVVNPMITLTAARIIGRMADAETAITNLEATDLTIDGRLDAEETATAAAIAADNALDARIDPLELAMPDKLEWTAVPASASATGVAGQVAYEAGWLYVCVDADTWQRVAIATWV